MRVVESVVPEPDEGDEPVEIMQAPADVEPEIRREAERLRIRAEAQRLHAAEQAASLNLPELVGVDEVLGMVPADPLLGELLYRDTLAQMDGAAGSFKSFVAVGMACAIAAGRNWGQHTVERPGHILYVAAEGGAGIGVRLAAWCKYYGLDPSDIRPRFHVMTEPIQLGVDTHVEHLLNMAQQVRPDLIVLDTRARVTVGMEENSATEQGIAVENLERIRRATGACALVVHHTGRAGGERGSSAWTGAVWTNIESKRSGLNLDSNGEPLGVTLTVHKHKDAEKPPPQSFDMESARVPQEWMPNVRRIAHLSTLVATPTDEPHTPVETKASREERKGDEGQKVRAWLLAQHAETGRVPGRERAIKWKKDQGLKLGNGPLQALINEVKSEVES